MKEISTTFWAGFVSEPPRDVRLLATIIRHFGGKVLQILTQTVRYNLLPTLANDKREDHWATIAFCNSLQQEAIGHWLAMGTFFTKGFALPLLC